MQDDHPQRKTLPHLPPFGYQNDHWDFFITICCRPKGKNQLCRPAISKPLLQSFPDYTKAGKWWCACVLLMPDHLHGIFAFPQTQNPQKVIRDWKRYQARTLGIEWQDGFFDHRLRTNESADATWDYIRQNPVRAGLAKNPEEWQHWWQASSY